MNEYEKEHIIQLDPSEFDQHCLKNGDAFQEAGLDKTDFSDGCVSPNELSSLLKIPYQDALEMIMQGKIYAETDNTQGSGDDGSSFRVPASAILFHLDMWKQNYDLPQIKAMFNSWMSTKSGKTPTAEQFFTAIHK